MAASFIAVYRGETVGSAEIVGLTADPEIVAEFVDRVLEREPEYADDPVQGAAARGRREALELIRDEVDSDEDGSGDPPNPPVSVSDVVEFLTGADEDESFTLEIESDDPSKPAFWCGGRAWYVANMVELIATRIQTDALCGRLEHTPLAVDAEDGGGDE